MAETEAPEPEPVEALAEVVPKEEQKLVKLPPRTLSGIDKVAEIQDRIYQKAHEVIDGVQDFAEVADDATEPPPEWVEKHGARAALTRFRLAKYGKMSAKEAPVGIKVAEHIATSIARTKAMERAPTANLNVAVIYVQGEKKQYPVLEVDE